MINKDLRVISGRQRFRPIVYQGRCKVCEMEMWGGARMKLCKACRKAKPHWKTSGK